MLRAVSLVLALCAAVLIGFAVRDMVAAPEQSSRRGVWLRVGAVACFFAAVFINAAR